MLKTFASVTLAAFGLAPLLSAAEPSLDRLVPGDVALVFALNDLPGLRKEFPESATGRAWADPDIAKFFAPLTTQADIAKFIEQVKAETGYTPEELLEFATGDLLLTVPAGSLKLVGDEPRAEALLALDVGDNQTKLAELIAEQRKKAGDSSGTDAVEDYNGAVLHVQTPAAPKPDPESGETPSPGQSIVWTLHQGRWLIGTNREVVTGALDALAAGGLAASLDASPDYQAIIARSGGEADALFFVNWKAIYPAVLAAVEAKRDPAAPPNMFGVEPANVMNALGLDVINGFSFTAVTTGDIDRIDAAFTYSESRGLPALLAYRDGPVARPDWVPAAWFNVSSQNFSVSDAYSELERIVDRISPMVAGMAQGQIKTFERQLGLELKRDLLGSLGTSFIGGYALPPGANPDTPPAYDELDQFIGFSLADADAFARVIDTIKGKFLPPGEASPLKKRDYLGRALYTFEPPADGRGVTYAITDGWLLIGIGSPGSVESVVQLMNTPKPDASYWQRKDVRDALAATPAGAFSVQHTDLAPVFASLAASLVKLQAEQAEEDGRFIDPAATPTREQLARFFKFSVGHGVRGPDGLYFHSEGPAR